MITKNELDRLLLQLINQTAPERPSDDEAQAVIRWAEGVRVDEGLLTEVLAGRATVRIVDGQPMFKLTPEGRASAEQLLETSPKARAYHDTLVAKMLGKSLSKGPDGKQ
jgi:hypothetical protein